MDNKEVQQFYDTSLRKSTNKYEYDRWLSSPRRKVQFDSTHKALLLHACPNLQRSNLVLEVGPGPGTWTKVLLGCNSEATYNLVDISEEMLKQAKEQLRHYTKVNYEHSDFVDYKPKQEYDFFFSSRNIEYVQNQKAYFKKIYQSLRSGGRGYLVTKTPHYKRFLRRNNNSPLHQGQIAAEKLRRAMRSEGLVVDKTVNVTSVFPGASSAYLDKVLTKICSYLPFNVAVFVSESYAIIFHKP